MASTTAVAPETPGRGDPNDAGDPGPLTFSPSPGDPAASELAALEAARDEKRQLLERAAQAAAAEPPGTGELPAGCGRAELPALLQRYFWSEPAAEVLSHDPAELAALALDHLALAEVRPQGSATVDVTTAGEGEGAGARGGRAIVRIVTDDMPFLVDSVTAEVVRQGAGLQHVVHPVVVVRRDVTGRIRAFCDSARWPSARAARSAGSWLRTSAAGSLQ
jgi:glutamate dehydrogenase